jgi:hypothetical protein
MSDGRNGTGSDILHVPVAVCSANIVAIRTARLASGERVGLGFTSQAGLAAVLGAGQPWVLIHLGLLREMLAPRGIITVQVDPLGSEPATAATRPASQIHAYALLICR